MTTDTPDEIIAVAFCRGCELMSLAGDLEPGRHPDEHTGDLLQCPRCGSKIAARDFFDYADMNGIHCE